MDGSYIDPIAMVTGVSSTALRYCSMSKKPSKIIKAQECDTRDDDENYRSGPQKNDVMKEKVTAEKTTKRSNK